MRKRCDASGFTLFELMVVLAIMAIVTAFAVPSFTRYRTVEYAKSNASNIASVLREARQSAIREGRQYIVIFNPAGTPTGTIMRIVQDADNNRLPIAAEPGRNVSWVADPGGVVREYRQASDQYNAVAQPDGLAGTLNSVQSGNTFLRIAAAPYGNGTTTGTGPTAVVFNSRGIPINVQDGSFAQGSGGFYVTDTRGNVFAATVTPLGEVRLRSLGAQGVWQ